MKDNKLFLTVSDYSIAGGYKGGQRLDVLNVAMKPATEPFLNEHKALVRGKCLDLGCGNGHVTMLLATVGGRDVRVEGWDIDPVNIAAARANALNAGNSDVIFREANARDLDGDQRWDTIYARFLFSHLDNAQTILKYAYTQLNTGGTILIEDTDFSGHFCHPSLHAFDTYIQWYAELLGKRGSDADIGKRLYGLLEQAGFSQIEMYISQPVYREGPGKLMAELTLDAISAALQKEQIAIAEDIRHVQAELSRYRADANTVMSLPRIFQLSAIRE